MKFFQIYFFLIISFSYKYSYAVDLATTIPADNAIFEHYRGTNDSFNNNFSIYLRKPL